MRTFLLFTLLSLVLPSVNLQAAPAWKVYENCTMVEDKYHDGDSFQVKVSTGYTYVFRLYFVDCPETDTRYPDRIKEQAAEFRVPESEIVRWGEEASEFTRKFLSKPFTVHTRKETARGSSNKNRYFAVVESGGVNLAEALVENGYARAYGMPTAWPDDKDGDRYMRHLRRLEERARSNRTGIWRDLKR